MTRARRLRTFLTTMLLIAVTLSAAADGALAATAWPASDRTPWPSVGYDARNWRHVPGVPDQAAAPADYRLAWVYDWNDNQASKWVIADLDGNGNQEIIITHDPGGYLAAIEAFEGPLWVFEDDASDTWTYSVPAVGDMDDDGELDILFPHRSGWVYRLTHEGQMVWRHDTEGTAQTRALLVDPNGDKRYFGMITSQVVGNAPHNEANAQPDSLLYAFGADGVPAVAPLAHGLTVDPFALRSGPGNVEAHLVLAPFQFLPNVWCDDCPIQPPTPTHTHVLEVNALEPPLDLLGAGALSMVPATHNFTVGGRIAGGPILIDLDGDAHEEIVLVQGPQQGYPGIVHSDPGQVLVLGRDMEILALYTPRAPIFQAAAIGDIVPGGLPELVIGTYDGVEVLQWRDGAYTLARSTALGTVTDLATADLDADGRIEIVATVSHYLDESRTGGVVIIDDDGTTHELIQAAPSPRGPDNMMRLTIADMDSDGSLDIVSYSYNGLLYLFSATRGGGPELETRALQQREAPGYFPAHERLVLDPEIAESDALHILQAPLLALAALLLWSRWARARR